MVCQESCAKVLPKFIGQEHTYDALKSMPLLPLQTSKKKVCSQKTQKVVPVYEEKRHKELCMKNIF